MSLIARSGESFPFTAIVGQDQMKLALILNIINPKIGGVLVFGEKGTAKSTAVRSIAALLPELSVVKGCRFRCDPKNGQNFCPECLEKLRARGVFEEERLIDAARRLKQR